MTAWCCQLKHSPGSLAQADDPKVNAMLYTFNNGMRAHPRRGAATLVIVMVLFFMVSMVAAYTSRNLIFEQRTGANQYRSSQALEAGDAAVEWALAHLNSGRLNSSCTASTDETPGTDLSFRERYFLPIDAATGSIAPRAAAGAGSVQPRCVFDGGSTNEAQWRWNCHCPLATLASPATATIAAPATPGPAPAFVMRFLRPSPVARPEILILDIATCTKLSADCINFTAIRGSTGDGVARVTTLLALRGALTRIPAGAITLSGSLQAIPVGTSLAVSNIEAAANGVTLHVGIGLPSPPDRLTLSGLPGAAGSSTVVVADNSLTPAAQGGFSSSELKFGQLFGLRPETYKRQPGLPVLDCRAGCDANLIRSTLTLNPGRPIWLEGNGGAVTLDGIVGTAALPALLIVEGDIVMSAGAAFTGLLYGSKPNWTWTVAGAATVRGGAVGEGNLTLAGGGAAAVTYDAGVLRTLRVGQGTFVRVPGSWKDF